MQTPPPSAVASPERLPGSNEDVILLLGRLALGAIFVKSGMQKLMALGAFAASLAGRGIPQSEMWAVVGALVECIGGILIVTGFRTRPAALLMVLFVIVATAISHRYWEFADAARRAQESQFFKNLSIIGGFLLLFASGPGRFSIDGLWRRRAQGNRSRPM
jgi:putative oxidoreductase